jgi:hypothetical protein
MLALQDQIKSLLHRPHLLPGKAPNDCQCALDTLSAGLQVAGQHGQTCMLVVRRMEPSQAENAVRLLPSSLRVHRVDSIARRLLINRIATVIKGSGRHSYSHPPAAEQP